MIYFDNAATTKPCKAALEALNNTAESCFGNAGSLHKMGLKSELAIKAAKKTILDRLGLKGDLIFTSCATESNNLALLSAVKALGRRGNRIVSTTVEHPSVARTLDKLAEDGFDVVRLSPAENIDNFEESIAAAVNEKTILVTAAAVNSETGFIVDSKRLYAMVKRKNPDTIVHIDGVQGFCKIPLFGDMISLSAHKIHGIKGVGALYFAKGVRLFPLLYGGGQQGGIRSGTEPVELISAFAAAAQAFPHDNEHFNLLCETLKKQLCGFGGITINSYKNVPNILNFSVDGIKSEILLHFFEENDICVSSGSACSRGKKSEILKGFGVEDRLIDSAIRVSFCQCNTEDEIKHFIDTLGSAIERFGRIKHI